MTTYSKLILSGSTNGRKILVAQTVTPGTPIHTAHATALDEIWLWADSDDATSTERLLTVEFGGVTTPGDTIRQMVPPRAGLIPIVEGLILTGGTAVKAFCATASVVGVIGFVNRIT